ncbi:MULTISPECIES: hypothetical protein [unclassified Pseudomonas]|uniref:hypothetical protein n=1 Tax=unclassified Pseudomonas TaxID=196821 RepID=UPI000A1F0AE0|nr:MULTISPECIES: hypothetical protein [unclassified Pseudomonas]MDI2144536.1 hypothetical protein [Pseudomonas sp. ITA]
MKFTSEGEVINPCSVGYRSLGFGESTNLQTKNYELTAEFNELPVSFIKCANSFIEQCKIDDAEQGFPEIPELEELQYPDFLELVKKSPKQATELIKNYLYFDLLFSLFPNTNNLKLVINNITSISTTTAGIAITGETFPFKS